MHSCETSYYLVAQLHEAFLHIATMSENTTLQGLNTQRLEVHLRKITLPRCTGYAVCGHIVKRCNYTN